jgi:hypothetical protein
MREDRYTNAKGLGYLWGIFPFFFLFLLQRQADKKLRHGTGNEGRKQEDRRGKTKAYVCACASRSAAATGPLQSEGCLLDGK